MYLLRTFLAHFDPSCQGQADRAEKLFLGAIELANEIGAKAWFLRAQNDLASLKQGRRLFRGPLDRRRNGAAKQHRDENSRPVQNFAGKS